MGVWIFVLIVVAVVTLVGLAMAIKIVRQYEKGVLFRFGRLIGTREPGLRIVTMPIQSQGIITRDNVSVASPRSPTSGSSTP